MLETKQNEYNTIKANYEKKKIILYNTKVLRDEAASKLTQEETELSAKIDEYRNQILAVEAEISKNNNSKFRYAIYRRRNGLASSQGIHV